MTRGDIVTVAMPGDFGKPRPALIIRSDRFAETGMVAIMLISGTLVDAPLIRTTVLPSPENGLRNPSQIMIDKTISVRRARLGLVFGRLETEIVITVTRSLAVFLGIA